MRPSTFQKLRAAVLAAGAFSALSPTPAGAAPAAPGISPARHLKFTPQPGTAWFVEGTTDGETWGELGGPYFANGGPVDHFQPAGAGAPLRFRLRFANPATTGPAPATVSGTSVFLGSSVEPVEIVFMNEVRGMIRIDAGHARSFTYTWLKKSPGEGEAILSGTDGTFTLLRLTFLDGRLGRWGMEDIPSPEAAASIGSTLDSGAFTFREGRFRNGKMITAIPLDLAGGSLVLDEAGRLTHVRFTGATSAVVTVDGGTVVDGSYAYDPQDGRRGRLRLETVTGPVLDLALDLSAPGNGRFEEVLQNPGGNRRSGTFTLPEEQAPPDNAECPPDKLEGRSLMMSGSKPCTLTFNGDGTGVRTKEHDGALQTMNFNYSYSRTGGNSASVAVTYEGAGNDVIDDYNMNFDDDCNGSFQRSSYSGGNADAAASASGTFGPGGLAGRFLAGARQGLGL